MITIRPAGERARRDHGWLETRFTFSFADYHDPEHMGFRSLRVLNEDVIQPGTGFGEHGHRDMEILSFVLEGALEHRDSMGNGSVIRPREVQRMTAGTGVRHSEVNPSQTETTRLLQVWILPDREGAAPGYEQRAFETERGDGRFGLLVSPDGEGGSLSIGADARVFGATLAEGDEAELSLPQGRHAWVQVASGEVSVNGVSLQSGDGAAVSEETRLGFAAILAAEVLVFELA